jgi:hypothetical protein
VLARFPAYLPANAGDVTFGALLSSLSFERPLRDVLSVRVGRKKTEAMAKCAFCGTETELHNAGVPVCVECDRKREQGANASGQDDARVATDKDGRQSVPNMQSGG